jgi:hypothetical protein
MSFILQPAAAGGTISMTAGANIVAQRPVIANASGQAVEAGVTASTTVIALGAAQTQQSALGTEQWMAYDSANDRYVVAFSTAGAVQVAVLQLSAAGAVWGTPVAIAGTPSTTGGLIQLAYDATAGKILIWYSQVTTGYPAAVVATVNPTTNTITLGTPATVESVARGLNKNPVFYNAGIGKCICVWNRSTTPTAVSAVVATITGTSVSFGPIASVSGVSGGNIETDATSGCAHPTNGKFAVFFGDASYTGINAVAATVSGTTITFGTAIQTNPFAWGFRMLSASNAIYDPQRDQFLGTFNGQSGTGGVCSFTVTGATTVTFIAATTAFATAQAALHQGLTYNTSQNIINCVYSTTGSSCLILPILNTGAAFTEGTPTSVATVNASRWVSVYNASTNRSFLLYGVNAAASTPIDFANGTTNLTATNYVGIAAGNVSSGALATINVLGSTATVAGVVAGTAYAVQPVGGLVPVTSLTLGTFAGVGIASNTLLLKG